MYHTSQAHDGNVRGVGFDLVGRLVTGRPTAPVPQL